MRELKRTKDEYDKVNEECERKSYEIGRLNRVIHELQVSMELNERRCIGCTEALEQKVNNEDGVGSTMWIEDLERKRNLAENGAKRIFD